MVYALDTNVILDILLADPKFGPTSRDFVAGLCTPLDSLVACDVVWAEASAAFADKTAFAKQMAAFGVDFSPMPESAAVHAGEIWKLARLDAIKSGDKSRLAIVPDFLIGAHALECADALVTRDRGFMRKWFSTLKVVDPAAM